MGYAGGSSENPTYYRLGDHTETLQVDYDPERISYERLLEIFWEEHDPTSKSWSPQYKAAIFYHNEEQKRMAFVTRERIAAKLRKPIHTEVIPFSRFFVAEDYHQKYYLRQSRQILIEFNGYYPKAADLMNSTAAARVNGYLGGYGHAESLKSEIEHLGLSEESRRDLLKRASGRL